MALKVEIVEKGRVVRVVRLDDPRDSFCKSFNSLGREAKARVPHPRSRATRAAKAARLSE